MAKIFDTHTHFNDDAYKQKNLLVEDMIEDAKKMGVDMFCCAGFDLKSSSKAARYALKYNGVYAAVGIHPTEAHKIYESDLESLDVLANAQKVVAIGEIGLDYYYTDENKEKQKKQLINQIKIAKKYDLAVMLHLRDKDGQTDAYYDALEIVKDLKVRRGVVHCFTQGIEIANEFIKLGFMISIPGVVTFKNATILQDAVRQISLNNLVVETDAPYLTPEPYRGKINQSKYIKYTVDKIAKIKKLEVDDVVSATTQNAKKMFNIK